MKRTFLFVIIAVLSVLTFVGCKKYKEGPAFSFISKSKRADGVWKAIFVSRNGENFLFQNTNGTYHSNKCSQDFQYSETVAVASWVWTLLEGGKFDYTLTINYHKLDLTQTDNNCLATYTDSTKQHTGKGTWSLSSDTDDLELDYDEIDGITWYTGNAFFNTGSDLENWKINKLGNNEMKLEASFSGTGLWNLTFNQ